MIGSAFFTGFTGVPNIQADTEITKRKDMRRNSPHLALCAEMWASNNKTTSCYALTLATASLLLLAYNIEYVDHGQSSMTSQSALPFPIGESGPHLTHGFWTPESITTYNDTSIVPSVSQGSRSKCVVDLLLVEKMMRMDERV